MEPQVTIRIRLEDEEPSTLKEVPISFEELCSAVYRTTGAVQFKVKFRDAVIKNDSDLFTAYLENKEDSLEFLVDEDLQSTGYLGSAVDNVSKHLKGPQSGQKVTVTNGTIEQADLIRVIDEMTNVAQRRLLESNRNFMALRQQFYETDENKWKAVVYQQLQEQEGILMRITGEVCHSYGLNPEIFQNSCRKHATVPEVGRALEEMAVKTLQGNVEIPESLTKEKMREVMEYICSYLDSYLNSHPPRNGEDFILFKIREGDEIMKRFGYDENEIAQALVKYGIDTEAEWGDIRDRLNSVMARVFPPQMMGGMPGMGMGF
eukprot:CAMPEP_0202946024 /NCGR_PEP_ID=MMETSP1395-20130829/8155_1 /ASSEMBLY_ACC=CAM_ASM_000871 /TAXON_ID=5961 /ORGANISM="Blepharisma japonicum, Strain Stock R1072" /LENGTH=318 /DNA_ID=CAMNT_0049646377 /DNA_START=14 /DNA_END=970 /DNA_ORIENTATION=+